MRDPTDGKPGLRLETAASIIARNFICDHFTQYGAVVRRDKITAQAVTLEFVTGLAGACALAIAGGHASKDEILNVTIATFREYVDRDLQHLGRK